MVPLGWVLRTGIYYKYTIDQIKKIALESLFDKHESKKSLI